MTYAAFISFDQFSQIVDAQAQLLPEAVFRHLNLGVGVVARHKYQPLSRPEQPLYILGEYQRHHAMGRGIILYYGSFMRAFAGLDEAALTGQIARVLKHELTHHLESLAGARDLEIADAAFLHDYLSGGEQP